ncbi:MAG: hypothetical protein EA420_18305 [Candidatus Competibacteraceae bacterium]|nr:MAG: hypothetical protein EA420_18305 [Candidatus Competibacteraceae bacterium]
MRSLMGRLKGVFGLLLLTLLAVSWGMVDANAGFFSNRGGGGFTARAPMTIEISADKTTLPPNILNGPVRIGGPYTNTITVQVKQNGRMFPAPSVSIDIVTGLSGGALFFLDGNPDNEDDDGNPLAFRRLVFEDTTGVVTGHFHVFGAPGTVVLRASAADPQTGQTASADLVLTISGGGVGEFGPRPAMVNFVMDPTPVYIRTNPDGTTPVPQRNFKVFQIFVLDDFGQPIDAGAGNMLRIELLPNRPNGGEWLSAIDANGNAQQGTSIVTKPIGGAATVVLHSGTVPGTVMIAATADRADNNVDNGIEFPITNYATVSIGTGELTSLTFAGPFMDAVRARRNALGAQLIDPATLESPFLGAPTGALWNGIFTRFLSVIASDPYGNPPPAGTPITFRLIDGPLDMLANRYPDQGHGQFAITGFNGDPQEGSFEFFAPNRQALRVLGDTLNPFVVPNGVSFALANPGCLLVLQDPEIINPNPSTINSLPSEGRPEYHVGSRIITGRMGNMLLVNAPFNQTQQNVGANVWYTVGCPPHKGNVMNFNQIISPVFGAGEVIVTTDASGIASTVMNYPASQVGRRFMVVAESVGGKVGAVMTHWYLGIPNGNLILVQPAAGLQEDGSAVVVIPPGTGINQPITLQLFDGGVDTDGDGIPDAFTPVPGVPITVEVVINDPTESAAIVAEQNLAVARVVFEAFEQANPGVCDLVLTDPAAAPAPRDPERCGQRQALAAAVDQATTAAVAARTIANLYNPTAKVVPATLTSVGGGFVNAVLEVNDLPLGGSVDFLFSTIGPDVSSNRLRITVQTPQPEEPPPNGDE